MQHALNLRFNTMTFKEAIIQFQYPMDGTISSLRSSPSIFCARYDSDRDRNFVSRLIITEKLSKHVGYKEAQAAAMLMQLDHGLRFFKHVAPNTYDEFGKTIVMICLARLARQKSGSTSNRIGLIWLCPERKWTTAAFAEHIVHEFVHNCLFLHEMAYGVFSHDVTRMSCSDAMTKSAIRQQRRRFDLAFHSALVAYTLARFYILLGERHRATRFIAPLMDCLVDLANRDFLLTEWGRALFKNLASESIQIS